MRTITTEDSQHGRDVANALLIAAKGDRTKVRTVTGPNGLTAFEVDDDFPDVKIPEAGESPAGRGRRRRDQGDDGEQQATRTGQAVQGGEEGAGTEPGDENNGEKTTARTHKK